MKNSEAVAKIINSIRGLTKDDHISRRYVLKLLRDSANTIIAQKIGERTITDEDNLYTELKCVEFEKDDIVRCPIIEFRRCRTLMKSKKPIPKPIYGGRIGAGIKDVTDLDGLFEFKVITADQYRRNNKRKYTLKNETYIILGTDLHLYIPDEEVYSVNLKIITQETEKKCGCDLDECDNAWDSEFIVPDKVLESVFKDVLNTLSSTFKNIVVDELPNLNTNVKN